MPVDPRTSRTVFLTYSGVFVVIRTGFPPDRLMSCNKHFTHPDKLWPQFVPEQQEERMMKSTSTCTKSAGKTSSRSFSSDWKNILIVLARLWNNHKQNGITGKSILPGGPDIRTDKSQQHNGKLKWSKKRNINQTERNRKWMFERSIVRKNSFSTAGTHFHQTKLSLIPKPSLKTTSKWVRTFQIPWNSWNLRSNHWWIIQATFCFRSLYDAAPLFHFH